MQILVFGKDGQLGKAFQQLFAAADLKPYSIDVQYIGRADCDLSNAQAIASVLKQAKPDVIINAAAYTAVDKAESEPELAHAVNAITPAIMAQYAADHEGTFLHYSTDYVFDGSKSDAYLESDERNPLGQYGKSKAAGEEAIEQIFAKASSSHGQYAILRTSWVYGDGGNFIKTILRLSKERESLRIIEDQRGVPTSTEWLAAVSLDLIFSSRWELQKITSGIYHAVPQGETSWHGLATLAIQTALDQGVSLKIDPQGIEAIRSIEYPVPAPRPMNSRMSTQKLRQAIAAQADVSKLQRWEASWTDQVRAYVQKLAKEQII